MRLVIALGGNALLERGERPDAEIQRTHIRRVAAALAPLAAEHELIICHGNGPQVGVLSNESTTDRTLSRPYPLDVLGAQTQGMIGYWLTQELHNAGANRPVVALITQTVVRSDDPAFDAPTKFIGPVYTRADAKRKAREYGWAIRQDDRWWRRVVPSPLPLRLVEAPVIQQLLQTHCLVICGGGGGAPVVQDDDGRLLGVEAVVDKDLTAAMIAIGISADRLIILTDVPAVMKEFGTPRQEPIRRLSIAALDALTFPAGSMAPKVAACRQFTTATGRRSAIGALADAAEILTGTAGTTIRPDRTS